MSASQNKRSLPIDSLDSKQIKCKEDLLQGNYILDNINKDILTDKFVEEKQKEIEASTPYEWGYLKDLFNPDLLNSIRKEIESNIRFTEKETDIYRVNQSGDLANLNKLSDEQIIEKLPSLYILQNIIYSKFWRDYISKILKCGPLSAVKTDLSVNTYDKGCHLLIHDDVISSRRVSFILYLPEQALEWKASFGGNLKLYDSFVKNIPMSDAMKHFVPQFNSMAFFEVQPGYSFHEVEEVKVDKHRISIQGWYHIPQRGEEGFVEGEEEKWLQQNNSTLKQLKMGGDPSNLQNFEFPNYNSKTEVLDVFNLSTPQFTEQELKQLSDYISPKYMPDNFEELKDKYKSDGEKLIINNFLKDSVARVLKKDIRNFEINIDAPKNYSEIQHPWKCAWPTNKWRFLYIDGKSDFKIEKGKSVEELISYEKSLKPDWEKLKEDYEKSLETEGNESDDAYITDDELENECNILSVMELNEFLNGKCFKKYLSVLTNLDFKKEKTILRRFRPGYDYTLATTGSNSLDFNLGLTPTSNWHFKMGGYQIYMKNDEAGDEDDDAVYKRSNSNSDEDMSDDGVLLNEVPEFNKLVLIRRSKMDLDFIKYLSANCNGSRWDVQGTFDI